MNIDQQKAEVIFKSITRLVSLNKRNSQSQRNLLNKWFQDSIKNYILEQIASPLIAKQLKCKSSKDVKQLIHSNIDKEKPKYMSIIDQYFSYINLFQQRDNFIKRLNLVLDTPIEVSQSTEKFTYNQGKVVRKQFVCFLILRFFQAYGQQDIPSFYELWNYCYPSNIQIKKKLSKFDIKETKFLIRKRTSQSQNVSIPSSPIPPQNATILNSSSSTLSSSLHSFDVNYQCKSSNNHNLNLSELLIPQQANYVTKADSKKIINNRIFEVEDEEEEEYGNCDRTNNIPNFEKLHQSKEGNYTEQQNQKELKKEEVFIQYYKQCQGQEYQNSQSKSENPNGSFIAYYLPQALQNINQNYEKNNGQIIEFNSYQQKNFDLNENQQFILQQSEQYLQPSFQTFQYFLESFDYAEDRNDIFFESINQS